MESHGPKSDKSSPGRAISPKEDKHWLDYASVALSTAALFVSGLSWRASRETTEVALTPHISIEKLRIEPAGIVAQPASFPTRFLKFEVKNIGTGRLTNVRVDMSESCDNHTEAFMAQYFDVLDPGDDASLGSTRMPFSERELQSCLAGEPFLVEVQTTANSEWNTDYRACNKYLLGKNGAFQRTTSCSTTDEVNRFEWVIEHPLGKP